MKRTVAKLTLPAGKQRERQPTEYPKETTAMTINTDISIKTLPQNSMWTRAKNTTPPTQTTQTPIKTPFKKISFNHFPFEIEPTDLKPPKCPGYNSTQDNCIKCFQRNNSECYCCLQHLPHKHPPTDALSDIDSIIAHFKQQANHPSGAAN